MSYHGFLGSCVERHNQNNNYLWVRPVQAYNGRRRKRKGKGPYR